MYSNVGRVLKILAAVVCTLGITGSAIGGFSIIAIDEDLVGQGFLTIIFGSLLSWLSTLSLYGFGVLIENSDDTTQSCTNIEYKLDMLIKLMAADQKNQVPPSAIEQAPAFAIFCPHCEAEQDPKSRFCSICGHALPEIDAEEVLCPHCGVIQDANRSVCYRCNTPLR